MRTKLFTDFLQQLSDILPAESKSVHSDLLMPRITGERFWGARGAIAVMVGLCFTGVNPIQEEYVRNHFYRKALERKEKGTWKVVSAIAKTTPWVPWFVFQVLLDNYDTHEIFGNWLPSVKKALTGLKWSNPYLPDTRPVKPTQRKRGYTDKGSLGSNIEAPGKENYVSTTELRSASSGFADSIPKGARLNQIEDSRIRARELLLVHVSARKKEIRRTEEELLSGEQFIHEQEASEEDLKNFFSKSSTDLHDMKFS